MTAANNQTATAGVAPAAPSPTRDAVSAGGWSGLSYMAGQLVGALYYFPLARMLSKNDFGLFTEANLLYLTFTLLAETAIGQALIQVKDKDGRFTRVALWLAILISGIGAAICVAAAPLMARIYREDELTALLIFMAPGVLATGAGAVPHALLQRELDFRRKTLPETLGLACGGIGALIAAIAGAGVFSLAVMTVVNPLVSSIAAWWVLRDRPAFRRPDKAALREFSPLVGSISAGDLALYARLNTDYAVTGRMLGADALGAYSVAWSSSSGPLLFMNAFTSRVGYALFARLRDDLTALRAVFLSGVKVLATAAIPVFLSAIVIAPDLVPVTLGAKWSDAVVPLMVLFGLQLVRAVAGPGASLVLAMGKGRLYALVNLAVLPATAGAIYAGTSAGINGVAIGMSLAVGGATLIYLAIAMRILHIGLGELLNQMRFGVSLALIVVPAVLALSLALHWIVDPGPTVRLAVTFIGGFLLLTHFGYEMRGRLDEDLARLRTAIPDEDQSGIDAPVSTVEPLAKTG